VQHVDLLPTVLDLLGWAAGEACDGQSLLPAIRSGADVGREAFTDSPAHGHFAMRSGRYSLHGLHERDVTEMFDLVRDPQELNNLLATEPPPQYEPLADVFRSFFRPPAAGWRLRVQAPADSDVTLNFSARGRGPLAGAYVRRWGWTGPLYTYQPGSSVASAVFDVRRRQDMTVQVAPTDRTQTLEVSLKSETPFRVAFGGQTAAPRRTFSSVLVPEMAGRTLPQVEPRAHDKDLPLILIWYVPPENLGEQAEELPPEAVEELQGLGYL
jgi:hypothetical protein